MRVTFLIRDKASVDGLADGKRSSSIAKRVLPCMAEGNSLFFVTYETDSNRLRDAELLANLRDSVISKSNMRLMEDGASAKFGEHLYPRICQFERGLRAALVMAICVNQNNFDSENIAKLESHTLGTLEKELFQETSYTKLINGVANKAVNEGKAPSREELLESIEASGDNSLWDDAFGNGSLLLTRDSYRKIKNIRNHVMHSRVISTRSHSSALKTLNDVNAEIEAYITAMRRTHRFSADAFARANTSLERLVSMNQSQLQAVAEAMYKASGIQSQIDKIRDLYSLHIMQASQSVLDAIKPAIPDYSTLFKTSIPLPSFDTEALRMTAIPSRPWQYPYLSVDKDDEPLPTLNEKPSEGADQEDSPNK